MWPARKNTFPLAKRPRPRQNKKTHAICHCQPAPSNTQEQDRDRIIDWLLGHACTTKGKFLHASHKSPRRRDFKDFKAASRLPVHQDILEAGRNITEKDLAPLTGPTRQLCSLNWYHKLLQSILLNSLGWLVRINGHLLTSYTSTGIMKSHEIKIYQELMSIG